MKPKRKLPPPRLLPAASRPPVAWPGGKRVAVAVVIFVEHFPFGSMEISDFGWRDYGQRAGLPRLLDFFDAAKIPVTLACNAEAIRGQPDLLALLRRQERAVVAHGSQALLSHAALDTGTEKSLIRSTLVELSNAFGRMPAGWLTPGHAASESTYRLLFDAGLGYLLDWGNDDRPYWYSFGEESLLAIPMSSETDDFSVCMSRKQSGVELARVLKAQYEVLASESATNGSVLTIGLHPYVAGQPHRFAPIAETIRALAQHEHAWWTTCDAIYDWFRGHR